MPNGMRYGNRDWPSGSPISGERLSMSGEYTGQHKGTVIQGSLHDIGNGTCLRAWETVRYGTFTPDAGDSNFPDRFTTTGYTVTEAIKEISLSEAAYNTKGKVFENVPSKAELFTFKDGGMSKTAINISSMWSVT